MSPTRPPAPAAAPEPRPPSERTVRWAACPSRLPECGQRHGGVPGAYDESARRVSHAELAAAALLVGEGHHVRSLPDPKGRPGADFDVCGVAVEVKTLAPKRERPGGRAANDRSLYNRLASASRQGPVVLVMAEGSGLTAAAAEAGVRRFEAAGRPGRARAVRVGGDGFDLAWVATRGAEVERGARSPGAGASAGASGAGGRRRAAATRTVTRAGPGRERDAGGAGLG